MIGSERSDGTARDTDKFIEDVNLLEFTRIVRRQKETRLRPFTERLIAQLGHKKPMGINAWENMQIASVPRLWYIATMESPELAMFDDLTTFGRSSYEAVIGRDFPHNSRDLLSSLDRALQSPRKIGIIFILNPGKVLQEETDKDAFNRCLDQLLKLEIRVVLFSDDSDSPGGTYLRLGAHLPLRQICVACTGNDITLEKNQKL
ncbi:hypothetical protein C8R43DRAFT_1135299 [Mycena crocata]|nr:hypothetical protein C8R43DRAFT_1135299 [Mycena crocata]